MVLGEEEGMSDMVSHELEAATPVVDVEVSVAEPGVAVAAATAPFPFGHVVVEVNVDLLVCEFGCDGIEDLYLRESPIFEMTLDAVLYLESGGGRPKLRIVLDDLLVHRVAIAT